MKENRIGKKKIHVLSINKIEKDERKKKHEKETDYLYR